MRILLLTHRLPYAPNRGDRIRAYHLLKFLAARHEVDLVSLVHDRREAAEAAHMKAMAASVTGVLVNRPVRYVAAALALGTSRPLTHVLLHSARVAPTLERLIARTPPDVVVAYCTGMARYAMERPLDGTPWVLDMVDVDSQKWAALGATSRRPVAAVYRREAALLRAFERRAMGLAAATTVVSEKEQVLLADIAPGCGTVVVPNGIDVASFATRVGPAAEPGVVFCGVFDYAPNEAGAIWLATTVWPLVLRDEPRARLSLVGMNPTRRVRALASDPSIEVTGAVPDVRPYLWGAAVAVAPLHLARGLQNKVLEAIAAGLPCVVTPAVLDGLPAGVGPACVPAEDPGAFAAAIVELLRTSPDARRLRAGAADLESLNWERQLAPMMDLIEGAARSVPAGARPR